MMSSRLQKRVTHFLVIALSLMALTVIGANAAQLREAAGEGSWLSPETIAQRPRNTRDLWREVYGMMPELPLENQYVNAETGERDEESTLISRLIRYHIFIKARPNRFRLDWKLTLADYLGAYERMVRDTYPGANVLTENPLEGDKAAIASLSRQQRDRLVDVLTSLFNPNYLSLVEEQANREMAEGTQETVDEMSLEGEEERRQRQVPRLPQSGDVELLLP